MPLKKMCPKCGGLISIVEKMCEKCTDKYLEEKKESDKLYDKRYRDKRSAEFYHSKEWNVVRERVRQRDNGLCLLCLANKNIRSMNVVHHIEELRTNYSKRVDVNNLICLCSKCHNVVHGEYDKGNKREIQEQLRGMIGG